MQREFGFWGLVAVFVICFGWYNTGIITYKAGKFDKTISGYLHLADWRDVPECDYSSNHIVADYYSKENSEYFRTFNLGTIKERLAKGDTLRIGIDYYGLYGLVPLPDQVRREIAGEIDRGKIVIYDICVLDKVMYWRRQKWTE